MSDSMSDSMSDTGPKIYVMTFSADELAVLWHRLNHSELLFEDRYTGLGVAGPPVEAYRRAGSYELWKRVNSICSDIVYTPVKTSQERLLDALRHIKAKAEAFSLLKNIEHEVLDYARTMGWEDPTDLLQEAFPSWNLFSGDIKKPVPGGLAGASKRIWDADTPIGACRRDLLRHCIEYFEKKVNRQGCASNP